jgi:hypothetical protein
MNIIELAKRVGYPIQHPEWQKATEEFAALVEAAARADEREECAKLCESHVWSKDITWWLESTNSEVSAESGIQCANAIRARGTT